MEKKKKKISERQMELNRYYTAEIIKVLAKPMPNELEKRQSDISYAEAKGILKYAIHQIKMAAIRFECCEKWANEIEIGKHLGVYVGMDPISKTVEIGIGKDKILLNEWEAKLLENTLSSQSYLLYETDQQEEDQQETEYVTEIGRDILEEENITEKRRQKE